MIYFDYSATTPVDNRVLKAYKKAVHRFVGNPNSSHSLGRESKGAIDKTILEIEKLLHIDSSHEVIFTSGASEANNLAIKGLIEHSNISDAHIITTAFEHPSVVAPMNYLARHGFIIDIVRSDEQGRVDLNDLARLLSPKTILVSIGAVNSEIGIIQPLESIAKIVHSSSKAAFHCDATQAIGKMPIDLSSLDLVSFSSHKFYGLKGIGVLLRKKSVLLEPQIHGGHSTSKFRSGTPALPLIISLGTALKCTLTDFDSKCRHVKELSRYARLHLASVKDLIFNSQEDVCLPHIINVSLPHFSSAQIVDYLDKNNIYVSSSTACSSDAEKSSAVFALTRDDVRSRTCIRISLSFLSTKREVNRLIKVLKRMVSE
ncbi:MAG: cysteine desulfurase family protein [Bacilli bacterium]